MPDIVADGDNLGDHIATKSFKQIKGSDVASADAVTLGFGGNTFDITGTTTINHINNTNWVVGSIVIIHFDGVVTLTNNAGGLTGSEANILLSGDVDFTSSAGDALSFVLHDSTNWVEISRNVPTSSYTAPTLGSTTLTSGATIPTLSDLTLTGITLDSTDSNITENLYTVGDVNVNGAGTLDVQSGGTMHIGTDPIKAIDNLATKANPTFTGIVTIPNIANLETAVVANTAKISLDDNSVTLAKLAHGTADKYLGFDSSGVPAEKTVTAGGITISSELSQNTGTVTATDLTLGANVLRSINGGITKPSNLFQVTALECKTGTNVSGNLQIVVLNRNSITGRQGVIAVSSELSSPTANTVYKLDVDFTITCNPDDVSGLIPYIYSDDVTMQVKTVSGTGLSAGLTYNANFPYLANIANVAAGGTAVYIKMYYKELT